MEVHIKKNGLKQYFLLFFLITIILLFFFSHLNHYFNFDILKSYHKEIASWTATHYFLAVIFYIFFYIFIIAISISGAFFLSLVGGFLFGMWFGTLYAVIGASIGAMILFLAVRMAFADWFSKRMNRFLKKLEWEFKENTFYYLLTLRLIPIFPFWLINVISALLDIPLSTFLIATVLGIIPATLIYTSLGEGLGKLFESNQTPELHIIMHPLIFLPLLGLAILSLLPILYNQFYKKKYRKNN